MAGGIIDLAIGALTLQQPMPSEPMGMMSGSASGGSYFLLGFGVIVLLSGLYMLTPRMIKSRDLFGWLMIIYGVIMLFFGFGMITDLFAMMEGSTISGGVMIFVGVAMLFSGFSMRKM